MKVLIKSILIFTIVGTFVPDTGYAIDEDYFIPYTDNYGYEYDPETGTYIKKDNPTPAVTENRQSTHNTDNTASVTQQPMSVASPTATTNEETSNRLPLILAGAIVLLGIIVVFTRLQKKGN